MYAIALHEHDEARPSFPSTLNFFIAASRWCADSYAGLAGWRRAWPVSTIGLNHVPAYVVVTR